MTTVEDWNQKFFEILPILSGGIGILSLVIGIISLGKKQVARQGFQQDGRYLVSVRFPGQWRDIRDFVQPENPDVLAVCSQVGPDYWALYDFVCRHIDYKRDWGEFWQTPSETLRGRGDCEDSANLLTSLLRAVGTSAHTVLGDYQGYGHAWCDYSGQILETTYTQARPVPDPQDYYPYLVFHDQEVIEFWPGAMDELFSLKRDENAKLNLMAEVMA